MCMSVHDYMCCVQSCLTLCDCLDYSPQAPLSIGLFWQEYCNGLPFPSLGGLPVPEINLCLLWLLHCRLTLYRWAIGHATKKLSMKLGTKGLICCCLVIKCVLLFCDPMDRLFCPWDFPGKKDGMSYHFLLQRIFLNQGLNPHLPHWQVGSLPLSHWGNPCV